MNIYQWRVKHRSFLVTTVFTQMFFVQSKTIAIWMIQPKIYTYINSSSSLFSIKKWKWCWWILNYDGCDRKKCCHLYFVLLLTDLHWRHVLSIGRKHSAQLFIQLMTLNWSCNISWLQFFRFNNFAIWKKIFWLYSSAIRFSKSKTY